MLGKVGRLSSGSPRPGGGGHATAAGVGFQADLGAWFASCYLLAESRLDAVLSGTRILTMSFETKTSVDDIHIKTEQGRIFIQAKTNIALSDRPKAELAKVADQFVRQFLACLSGDGDPEGSGPLHRGRDRLLLAVGPGAPKTISADLAQALSRLQATEVAQLPIRHTRAINIFEKQVSRAWETSTGQQATTQEIRSITNLVTIRSYDFGGADRGTAEAFLQNVLDQPDVASATFSTIAVHCRESMAKNAGFDLHALRMELLAKGIPLKAPLDYRADVTKVREYSKRTRQHLTNYDSIQVSGRSIHVERNCTDAVVHAARDGSLLIVGEPGSGKSSVICGTAPKLAQDGAEVVVLAVDRLSGTSFADLGLKHPLVDVLLNWPGSGRAYLLIDALDASRRGDDDYLFRTLIGDVLSFKTERWSVIASVRTFDLRQGIEFKRLFPGNPPMEALSDPSLPTVAHIVVSPWTPGEFAELLRSAPELSKAIKTGGIRMRELASVPFNTRMIADLVTDGLESADFGEVRSQVQLLRLHWDSRVGKHGTAAERCLQATVKEMIESRRLRARKLNVACPDVALDDLLRENVLIGSDDQFVAFRHHILFDYAASRVFLQADDPTATAKLLENVRGVGFLLAPAVRFLLHELWHGPDDMRHHDFWRTVATICGDTACDPVARSVAARTASELPSHRGDALGLLERLSAQAEAKDRAVRTLRHVTGAFVVRFENQQHIPLDAWCEFTDCASDSEHISEIAWCIKDLLHTLCANIDSVEQLHWLGSAARRLLNFAIEFPSKQRLSSHAIEFVAMTYRSATDRSRSLLRRLFERDHFVQYADIEIPWLTRNLKPILAVDPDFVVEIYDRVYRSVITDETSTPVNNSQILPLSTSRRQDYESSWWRLEKLFPQLLATHHLHGVRALIVSVSGHIEREHKLENDSVWKISQGASESLLREDGSYHWARDLSNSRDACALIKSFVDHCLATEIDVIRKVIEEVIGLNEHAVLWSQTFLVASQRANDIGDLLWEFATQEPFLASFDTRDAATSFIAARYPYENLASRTAFEQRAMSYEFRRFPRSRGARRTILTPLFLSIQREYLATQEARLFSVEERPRTSRPHQTQSLTRQPDSDVPMEWSVLRHAGVDISKPDLRTILEATEEVKKLVSPSLAELESDDIMQAIMRVHSLIDTISRASDPVPAALVDYGYEVVGRAATRLSSLPEAYYDDGEGILRPVIDLVVRLSDLSIESRTVAGDAISARHVADAVMKLMRIVDDVSRRLLPIMRTLLRRGNNATREIVVANLAVLVGFDVALMWELAEHIAQRESERSVLRGLIAFLGDMVKPHPQRVEELLLMLHDRGSRSAGRETDMAHCGIEELITWLWIHHGRVGARGAIQDWVSNPYAYKDELRNAIDYTREALVVGYNGVQQELKDITKRAQQFYGWIATALIERLNQYVLHVQRLATVESDRKRGACYAKLLDSLCVRMSIATGASRSNDQKPPPLQSNASKRGFLKNMFRVLEGIGNVGAPHTVHTLIGLLSFLAPGEPETAFDLISNALVGGGCKYGYQFEGAAVDRVVEIVGYFLADHRGLFENEIRRRKLIDCLDVFVEAGWPAATRLLYRLPDLL